VATPAADDVQVLLRPEGLRLSDSGISARVVSSVYRGPVFEVALALAGTQHHAVIDCVDAPVIGADVLVSVDDAWVLPG
jgi:iron(III) transport system ATP-binding protein